MNQEMPPVPEELLSAEVPPLPVTPPATDDKESGDAGMSIDATLTEQQDIGAEQAVAWAEQALVWAEQSETGAEQAKTGTEQAKIAVEQAKIAMDQAHTGTAQAETRTMQATVRIQLAEERLHRAEERAKDVESRSLQAIRASELSYRRLFESARDGILILDVDTGRISDANPFLGNR